MAENGTADRCDSCICFLSCKLFQRIPDYEDPVLERTLSEPGMVCGSGTVLCGDRYSKRSQFTDGLDGLASSVTLIVAVFFTVVSLGMKSGVELSPVQLWAVLWDSFCLMYILPRYLWETPVLWALGGFVAGVAYAMQMPLFIILVGLIYLVEVLSVMIQVSYFNGNTRKKNFQDGAYPPSF